ncbi:hypothetical protein [Erwinia sorbitola]|uniref:Uncharacterized protein n=1 Tax=Erwinia sorbitola TaxID=2681984 RepID=A0A6I6ESP7_9GAMM|nr:hypothetical protein [Erwinia sorbitola]QGU88099.1 hypothetical protein GN242_13080 [Erwinia sorbitola]
MTAVTGATIGAISAIQGGGASPPGSATPANPQITSWERTTDTVLDFLESPNTTTA